MNSTLAPNFKKSGKYTVIQFKNSWKACLTAGEKAEWKGRYDRAERLFKRALRMIDESRQPNMLYAITTLMYLADLYMDQKKYKEAEVPLKSALTLCEGVIHVNAQTVPANGAPTPSLSAESAQAEIFAAHGLRCLAKIYQSRGRRAEASMLAN